MNICIYGLWHLGSVTAACMAAAGHDTVGLDPDPQRVALLTDGEAPVAEPGLDELIRNGLDSGLLTFSSDLSLVQSAEVVWVCLDTPIDEDDRADVAWVRERIEAIFPHLRDGAVVLVSSQVPVGTTAKLKRKFDENAGDRTVGFAYSPENLRLGQALDTFQEADRVVVGAPEPWRPALGVMLNQFEGRILWVSVESAEMVKHALNTFLATSIVLTNEIASVAERVGADAGEVEAALRTDPRVGSDAYVHAGPAFAGGTLARDATFLTGLASDMHLKTPLLDALIPSNAEHCAWPMRRIVELLDKIDGSRIGLLGLVYKPGTNTLRRSAAVELGRELHGAGATVRAYDPAVSVLNEELSGMDLVKTPDEAIIGSDALVLATPWPEFRELDFGKLIPQMERSLVIDAGGFLEGFLPPEAEYVAFGRAQ